MSQIFARSIHKCSAVVMMLGAVGVSTPAAAAGDVTTMTGGLEWSQVYRPDGWQPVRLELRNETEGVVDGAAVLPLSDAKGPAVMKVPVSVPPHSRATVRVWGYFPVRPAQTPEQRRQGQATPLSIAEWRSTGGALISRTEILGVPLSAKAAEQGGGETGEMVLLVHQRAGELEDAYDVSSLLPHLAESSGIPLAVAAVGPDGLPREAQGLRAIKAVVLDGVDPEVFDPAQRDALLDYLRGGGVVVLPAPVDGVARAGGWFQTLLPVRPIGMRVARQVELSPAGASLKLREPLPIVEAVEGEGGRVLMRGPDYVHVAVRPVGLGKVVFTSFPINALDESQPQVAVLWEQLLSLGQPQPEWGQSQLGEVRHAVLAAMIGRKVAPWGVAVAVAGGYLLVILAAQAAFGGASRPKAFVVSVGAALILSGLLLVMGMTRREDRALQAARLSVIDVSGDGGGWQRESVAYTGADDPDMGLELANDRAAVRPALADPGNRPVVRQQPFMADKAGVEPERIERVWEAAGPVDEKLRLDARAHFGPGGLTLEIDNDLGERVDAPLLVWNRRALAMADVPTGRSDVSALYLKDRDDLTGAGVLTSELSKRRAQVVRASLASPGDMAVSDRQTLTPVLVGWLPGRAAPALIHPVHRDVADAKSMVMVRTPVRVEPPQPGAKVSIPAAFVGVDTGKLPYDDQKGESVPSQQDGQWLIGFGAPEEAGQVRPTRVTLELRLACPAHAVSVRRGQCSSGQPRADPSGQAVAEWGHEVGAKRATFDCGPGDYDADGRVWVLLEVRSDAGGTASLPWQVKDVKAGLEAEAVAPPAAIVLDAPRRQDRSDEKP
jgi:hypothetical protein